MKRGRIQILSIAAILLLFTGCGSRESERAKGESAAVYPKEAMTAQMTEGAVVQEETEAAIRETEAAAAAERESFRTTDTLLTEEEARAIALKDAGVTEDEVSGIRIKLDRDDGVQEYEVDFYIGSTEYDYDIDAATGAIRSKDMDIENDFSHETTSGAAITEEEAKALALSKVPEASEGNIRIHQDYDDGRLVYEGSIIYNNIEYDFEIDAESGNIVEWEEDRD